MIKNNKEKKYQYISFVENSEKVLELQFKKAIDVEVENADGKRTAIELQCINEITKEEYSVIMHRGVKTYLKSIEVQKVDKNDRETLYFYTMRRGKGLVPGGDNIAEDKNSPDKEESPSPGDEKEEKKEKDSPEDEKPNNKKGNKKKPKR